MNAHANAATASLKADPTTSDEVNHGGECFAAIVTVAADGDDEIAKGVAAMSGLEGFFHGWMGDGDWAGKWSGNAGANRATVVCQADTPAFQKIGNGSGGFVDIPAGTAHCDDQVAEGQGGAVGGFEGLFHDLDLLKCLAGWLSVRGFVSSVCANREWGEFMSAK